MSMTFSGLQTEVKRRATRDQSGTTFDTAIKNVINFALFRISREAPWRTMRRKQSFDTVTSYTTGSGNASATSNNTLATITGATLLTDGVAIERKVKFSGDGTYYYIKSINGETTITLDRVWQATTKTSMTYEVLPQEAYNLPVQAGHRMFMWHEGYGYPFKLNYITDQDFFEHGAYLTQKAIPTHYRMWGEDWVRAQVSTASAITVSSSSSSDTSKDITIFGNVSGYPDYEVITTNGTTAVTGSKVFDNVERVVKGATTVGRITVTANSANRTVAVIPVGDIVEGIQYKKIQLYPLPNKVFPIYVQFYKDPYRLVNDGDVHELGYQFDEAIILLATSKLKAEQNLNTEADRFYLLWQDEMRTLRRTNMDKIDWFPTLRRPGQSQTDSLVSPGLLYKQAGSNFGPASYY